jgi:hypothetical protein
MTILKFKHRNSKSSSLMSIMYAYDYLLVSSILPISFNLVLEIQNHIWSSS